MHSSLVVIVARWTDFGEVRILVSRSTTAFKVFGWEAQQLEVRRRGASASASKP